MNDAQRLSLPPMPSGKAVSDATSAQRAADRGLCVYCKDRPRREDSAYCEACS